MLSTLARPPLLLAQLLVLLANAVSAARYATVHWVLHMLSNTQLLEAMLSVDCFDETAQSRFACVVQELQELRSAQTTSSSASPLDYVMQQLTTAGAKAADDAPCSAEMHAAQATVAFVKLCSNQEQLSLPPDVQYDLGYYTSLVEAVAPC